MDSDRGIPTVCILMGTYNGGSYLDEQLKSIRDQTYPNWRILISDDGSTDDTLRILRNFQSSMPPGKVTIMRGPRQGFAANFVHLVLSGTADGDIFAFSDQDDIWNRDKLKRAVTALSKHPPGVPAAYGTRTLLIDKDGNHIGLSPTLRRQPSFKNALAQNIAGGNTIVFNKELSRILKGAGKVRIVAHDWWIYLVVTAVNGLFLFDESPSLLYRQHSQNLVGTNHSTLGATVRRMRRVMEGRYSDWMETNISMLSGVRELMPAENCETLRTFQRARTATGIKRLVLLYMSGVRRQTCLGNVGLAALAMLKRI